MKAVPLVLLIALSILAKAQDNPDLHQTIQKRESMLADALASGNASAAADFYDPKAHFMPAGQDDIVGREAIAEYAQQLIDMDVNTVNFTAVEVDYIHKYPNGWAYERGTYQFNFANGTLFDEGNYLVIWSRSHGAHHWSAYYDIPVSSMAKSAGTPTDESSRSTQLQDAEHHHRRHHHHDEDAEEEEHNDDHAEPEPREEEEEDEEEQEPAHDEEADEDEEEPSRHHGHHHSHHHGHHHSSSERRTRTPHTPHTPRRTHGPVVRGGDGGPNDDKLLTAIANANLNWMSAFDSQDAAGVAALYEVNATLLPNHAPAQMGRDAIQAFFQGAMNSGVAEIELTIEEVNVAFDDNVAYEKSTYVFRDGDGKVLDVGKYIVVWRQLPGDTYRLYIDCFNSNMSE